MQKSETTKYACGLVVLIGLMFFFYCRGQIDAVHVCHAENIEGHPGNFYATGFCKVHYEGSGDGSITISYPDKDARP